MAYRVMAYIVIVCIVMACIVMACTVMVTRTWRQRASCCNGSADAFFLFATSQGMPEENAATDLCVDM